MNRRLKFNKNTINLEDFLKIMDAPTFEEYTYWENLKNRKIILNDSVNDTLVEKVIMQIFKFNDEDDIKGLPVEKRKPIEIFLNCEGGDVLIGMTLVDVIKNSKTPVHTIALGMACSMGGLILMAGHKRFAYSSSTILLHDGSLHLASSSKKAKQTMEYYDKLEIKIKNFILLNTKISEELYDQKSSDEWYMLGDEALEFGIIDKVIGG